MSYLKKYNKRANEDLVQKVLEQGQRLRNSMVKSILNNDPLHNEVLYSKHFNTPVSSIDLNKVSTVTLSNIGDKKLEAFLKGDYMTKEEEKLALDTFRSMSDIELCKTADRMYSGNNKSCNCSTCGEYNSKVLSCDMKPANLQLSNRIHESISDKEPSKMTQYIENHNKLENSKYFKCVDSLKVSVHNLMLNEAGNRKISSAFNSDKSKVPTSLSEAYFLEYQVPDSLLKYSYSRSKVNSGLDNNSGRMCARRHYYEAINFKQMSVHDINNLESVNLNKCELKFKITYRTARQKTASLLGYAIFHFSSFEVSKNLTCNRGLQVVINENVPIVLGTLKVSLQLGCGKLYFGQEFIDAISNNDINSVVLGSDDSTTLLNKQDVLNSNNQFNEDFIKSKQYKTEHVISNQRTFIEPPVSSLKVPHNNVLGNLLISEHRRKIPGDKYVFNEVVRNAKKNSKRTSQITELSNTKQETTILFGFLYIPEAQYLGQQLNSYLTCQPFCQNETSNSRLVTCSSHPVFNFYQTIPLVFDNSLLLQFRENVTVIEFWQRNQQQDSVFGLAKIPLHQFYIGYRNSVILKYLQNNKLPVIGVDWWEPIYDHLTDEVIGQVQVLIALGTQPQIKNLEIERGFKTDFVKAKTSLPIIPKLHKTPKAILKRDASIQTLKELTTRNVGVQKSTFKNQTTNTNAFNISKADVGVQLETEFVQFQINNFKDQTTNTNPPFKVDVGVQHSNEMDQKDKSKNNISEMLEVFFKQLAETNRIRTVENSTNTENSTNEIEISTSNKNQSESKTQENTNLEVRKTSDLLNSLQMALSTDTTPSLNGVASSKTFKANINICGALHLPSRKKAKPKKSKCRLGKIEESFLPSTYVTFETVPGEAQKITPIVSKCTSPEWNYISDVILPIDLLINNQKRLIFKIWRKSTNTNMVPNMQTDVVLGFAAVDLTVLMAGLPNVQGWFNIVDFTGKCNGQINIRVTPLENLQKYHEENKTIPVMDSASSGIQKTDQSKNDNEPGELLSRALKRKFGELDEITQRLRLRLSTVTNDESDTSNDEISDEFERDINTLCVEEDYDLIDFEEEAKKFSINHANNVNKTESILCISTETESPSNVTMSNGHQLSEAGDSTCTNNSLDRHLIEGKQRIDVLLEKLTLMTAESNSFSSRYVSGCSTTNDNATIDTEAILKELDRNSRPNIHNRSNFDAMMFQELYGEAINSENTSNSNTSSESILRSMSRPAPDGQGTSEEVVIPKTTNK